MKKVIISALMLPGCVLLNVDELGLEKPQPVDYKKEYWKIPCFVTGKTLDNINEAHKPKRD